MQQNITLAIKNIPNNGMIISATNLGKHFLMKQ